MFTIRSWAGFIVAGVIVSSPAYTDPVNSLSRQALPRLASERVVPGSLGQDGYGDTDSWQHDQVIYFPLTDRFCDGDPSNNYAVRKDDPAGFWGGDLKGLTSKLDYIKGLGATTIWLSPLADNTNEAQIGDYHGSGYHGYWIRDHYRVEEHQGDMADAQKLVQEAHKRGLKVVLDVVLNHVGPDSGLLQDPTKKDWFHNHGGINDWNNPKDVEEGDLGGLPDLDQDNPEAYKFLLDNTAWWVENTGVDGIRLDAVKHVSHDFWAKFVPDIKQETNNQDLFVMGEVFHGDPKVVSSYQKAGIDYLFDLPLYYTIRDTFGQGQSMRRIAERLASDSEYKDASKLVTVLDNHDLPRFLSTAHQGVAGEGDKRLKQALAFQMTVRGVPSIYYGTEAGFSGGEDPANREMMDFGARPDLKDYAHTLVELRKGLPALQQGAQREMWVDDQVYAFSRATDSQEVIAVFYNGMEPGAREIPLRAESKLGDGTVLVDALSGQEFRVENRRIALPLGPLTPMILKVKD